MAEQWCVERLEDLKIKENRVFNLEDLHEFLKNTPELEINILERILTCPHLYNCLEFGEGEENNGDNNPRVLFLLCRILNICMDKLSFRQENLPTLLMGALQHKHMRVRIIALKTIRHQLSIRKARREDRNWNFINKDILNQIFIAVREDSPQIGSVAFNILCLILEPLLTEPEVSDALLDSLAKSGVVKSRIYALAVELSRRSESTFRKLRFILDNAFIELDNSTIGLQNDILDLLIGLTEREYGATYMEKRKVCEKLERRLIALADDSVGYPLIPVLIKLTGKMCASKPHYIFSKCPQLIRRCLFECFDSTASSILPVAYEALGNIITTQDAVLLLEDKYENEIMNVFANFPVIMQYLPMDLKTLVFNSFENVFKFPGEVLDQVSAVLKRWFYYLSNDANHLHFLKDYYCNPYPHIKTSVFNFIGALCTHPWGIDALKNTEGFLMYLQGRQIEFNMEVKDAKYNLIKLLAHSKAFDAVTTRQLKNYVDDGP